MKAGERESKKNKIMRSGLPLAAVRIAGENVREDDDALASVGETARQLQKVRRNKKKKEIE